MNLNACLTLSRKLADVVAARAAMIANGLPLTDFGVMNLDKQARILAADLKAAFDEKQPVAPWTPWNQRASIVAHSPGCVE